MKTTQKISLVILLVMSVHLHSFADDVIAMRTEKSAESNNSVSSNADMKKFVYQIDVYTKTEYQPAAFQETHFLGPEIALKWNDFQQKYKVVHEQTVGLSGKTVEIVKPSVYSAVNKINNYLKKSLKKGEIDKSEVMRIMDHVLTCSIELYSDPDTSVIENEIMSAKNTSDLVKIFDAIKINYHIN